VLIVTIPKDRPTTTTVPKQAGSAGWWRLLVVDCRRRNEPGGLKPRARWELEEVPSSLRLTTLNIATSR
jgi:hypothetical protein